MQIACEYGERMKMLQIRNVPDDVHRQLKARAAMEGKSLSELALGSCAGRSSGPPGESWWSGCEPGSRRR
jgi:hypothetical protein